MDADIEIVCTKCKTRFRTVNAYHVGYSPVHYANPAEEGRCTHDLKELSPTKRYSK